MSTISSCWVAISWVRVSSIWYYCLTPWRLPRVCLRPATILLGSERTNSNSWRLGRKTQNLCLVDNTLGAIPFPFPLTDEPTTQLSLSMSTYGWNNEGAGDDNIPPSEMLHTAISRALLTNRAFCTAFSSAVIF